MKRPREEKKEERKPPRLPASYGKALLSDLLERGEDGEGLLFENERVAAGAERRSVVFDGCAFRNVVFEGASLPSLSLTDCLLENCDLSNAVLSGASFCRVELRGGRMTGAVLTSASFEHVLFSGVAAPYLNCTDASFARTEWEECLLEHAWFDSCRFRLARFEKARLAEASFFQTPMEGIDLSSSDIARAVFSPDKLGGLTVGAEQAPGLLALLGVKIV